MGREGVAGAARDVWQRGERGGAPCTSCSVAWPPTAAAAAHPTPLLHPLPPGASTLYALLGILLLAAGLLAVIMPYKASGLGRGGRGR